MLSGEFWRLGLPGGGGNWLPPMGSGGIAGPDTFGWGFGFTDGEGGGTGTGTGAGGAVTGSGGGTSPGPPAGGAGGGGTAGMELVPGIGKLPDASCPVTPPGMPGAGENGGGEDAIGAVGGGGGTRSAADSGLAPTASGIAGLELDTVLLGTKLSPDETAGATGSEIGETPGTFGIGNWLAVFKAEP